MGLCAEWPYFTREGAGPGPGGRGPQCCRLGVSTSRVRRWTCCGQGVGAGAGTQMSSHPAHGWAQVQREFPRGHIVAQAARLSSGGRDPFYLIKSQGTREGTGPPSPPHHPPNTHTAAVRQGRQGCHTMQLGKNSGVTLRSETARLRGHVGLETGGHRHLLEREASVGSCGSFGTVSCRVWSR